MIQGVRGTSFRAEGRGDSAAGEQSGDGAGGVVDQGTGEHHAGLRGRGTVR